MCGAVRRVDEADSGTDRDVVTCHMFLPAAGRGCWVLVLTPRPRLDGQMLCWDTSLAPGESLQLKTSNVDIFSSSHVTNPADHDALRLHTGTRPTQGTNPLPGSSHTVVRLIRT